MLLEMGINKLTVLFTSIWLNFKEYYGLVHGWLPMIVEIWMFPVNNCVGWMAGVVNVDIADDKGEKSHKH